MKQTNFTSLEMSLLEYWQSKEVEWLYKYKNCVKEYSGENRANIDLFTDITSGLMFQDIKDIANYEGVTGEDVKVRVSELIKNRSLTIRALGERNCSEPNT